MTIYNWQNITTYHGFFAPGAEDQGCERIRKMNVAISRNRNIHLPYAWDLSLEVVRGSLEAASRWLEAASRQFRGSFQVPRGAELMCVDAFRRVGITR